jgi:glycosyltransferase involved in cell wall biosynthesis
MPKSITQPRMPLIAAILPAYNEEKNVAAVLDVLHKTDILDEIILVDDGSTDKTAEVLRHAAELDSRTRVIQHENNIGKGQAIFTGWHATQATCLVLLDADLKNLTPDHIRGLIAPVLADKADMTLGLFLGGRIYTDLAHWFNPWSTGQRCLQSKILEHISQEAAAGYGFELALSITARQQGYRTRIVPMKGVWHPSSEFHRGFWFGIRWRARMYSQIFRAFWIATRHRDSKATKT